MIKNHFKIYLAIFIGLTFIISRTFAQDTPEYPDKSFEDMLMHPAVVDSISRMLKEQAIKLFSPKEVELTSKEQCEQLKVLSNIPKAIACSAQRLEQEYRQMSKSVITACFEHSYDSDDKKIAKCFAQFIKDTKFPFKDYLSHCDPENSHIKAVIEELNEQLLKSLYKKNILITQYWIHLGANVNATNARGDTPLHLSAEFGLRKHIALLLDNGASPHLVNHNGHTSLQLAEQKGLSNTARLLRNAITATSPQ